MPETTVVIPAYNAAQYLGSAIDSALTQTAGDVEVVVIDDGSTDDTPALMRRYGPPVRYIRQANGGVAAARNRGIAEAAGRFVAFLDADDVWEPRKLERQLAVLRDGGCRACCTAFLAVDARLAPREVHRYRCAGAAVEALLTQGNVVGTPSTVVVERALLAERGGFDPALSQCADWDLWVRLATATEFGYVDEPLVRYRVHDGNMSRNVPLLERDSLRVLEKGFAMPELPPALRARRAAAFARNWMVLAGCYYHAGRPGSFVRCALRALALDVRQGRHLVQFPARAWRRRRAPALAGG